MRLLTILDDRYPENLRAVHDRPPLIFVAGQLASEDSRAIAVIGARRATRRGIDTARSVAAHLVETGFTVASGLAEGIDTAAHTTALARGGRTIAVIGTGLARSYPPGNALLQARIATRGAVVSQFWPDSPAKKESFPMRNAVMSGLSLATVVVEAGETSGARTQARLALAHGRPVFLHHAVLEQRLGAGVRGTAGYARHPHPGGDHINRRSAHLAGRADRVARPCRRWRNSPRRTATSWSAPGAAGMFAAFVSTSPIRVLALLCVRTRRAVGRRDVPDLVQHRPRAAPSRVAGDTSEARAPPRHGSQVELAAVLWRHLEAHERCVAHAAGTGAFELVTCVPSGEREREKHHPMCRIVGELVAPTRARYERLLRRSAGDSSPHVFDGGKYETTRELEGSSVLLIDDMWTTGANAQSAAADAQERWRRNRRRRRDRPTSQP